MRVRRALVVGGSMAGLFAANLLARAGWAVELFERTAGELSGRGAGIVTHPALFAALARAGAVVDETVGVKVTGRVTLAPVTGEIVGTRDLPQILTSWSRLHRLLRDALPDGLYRDGRALVGVEPYADGVTIRFADGGIARGDLLVAADGIRSTVRQLLLPEARPVYAGYVAWRGLVEEAAVSPEAHAAIFEKFAFCLPPREQMLGYPVAGAGETVAPGRRRFNFVWYRPADATSELRRLLTDAEGRHWPEGIPPTLVAPAIVAEMRADARRLLAPAFAEMVERTPLAFFQPIFDLESPRMVFGRVALLGDAAFVARPHVGMGVTKAGDDAVSLVDHLARSPIDEALAGFEADRLPMGRLVVDRSRRLGAYMQAQILTPAERAAAERFRSPEAVMRETAVAPERAAA